MDPKFSVGDRVKVKQETVGNWFQQKMKKLVLDGRIATITSIRHPSDHPQSQKVHASMIPTWVPVVFIAAMAIALVCLLVIGA